MLLGHQLVLQALRLVTLPPARRPVPEDLLDADLPLGGSHASLLLAEGASHVERDVVLGHVFKRHLHILTRLPLSQEALLLGCVFASASTPTLALGLTSIVIFVNVIAVVVGVVADAELLLSLFVGRLLQIKDRPPVLGARGERLLVNVDALLLERLGHFTERLDLAPCPRLCLELVHALDGVDLGFHFSQCFSERVGRDAVLIRGALRHLLLLALLLQNFILLLLERIQLGLDVGVVVVGHVLAHEELGGLVVAPLLLLDNVVLLLGDVENSSSSELLLQLLDGRPGLLHSLNHGLGDGDVPRLVVPLLGLSDMHLAHDGLRLFGVLCLLGQSVVEQNVASLGLHVSDTVSTSVAHLNQIGVGALGQVLDQLPLVLGELLELGQVDLGEHDDQGFGQEEGLDVLEQRNLLIDGVAAGLRDVEQEEHAGVEVSQSGDGLHFDGVPLIEGVVEDAGSVNDLPSGVLVVGVAHEETLGGEGVGLHVHVGIGHVVDEAGLADVRVAGEDEGALVGVDGGEARHVLSDLLEVAEGGLELLDERAHPSEGGPLELLAAVERVSVLEEPDVVGGHVVHNILGLVDVSKGQFVVISIVKDVHEIGVEGVDVVDLGEAVDDGLQLLVDRLLHELDLAHVELPDPRDFEARRHHGRRLPLGLRERNVD
mmetsp:Transcript_5471/g.9261  ORF Transcript_5471/g.9261 Transcript_5471/m.9261 type:complete len:659 (+) Transcript_5471:197-2173(+)